MALPPRALSAAGVGTVLTGVVLVLGGCAGTLSVDSPSLDGPAARQCAELGGAAPSSVSGAEGVEVDTRGVALAWGDPPVVLRCGVAVPDALRPTSRCERVDGVDWFAQPAEDGYRFSTVGRPTTVELFVPYEYEPAGDALVDLAGAVRSTVPQRDPCR